MKITSPELEIPTEDPFKNDALKRAELEPPLSEIVTQPEDPFVLAIDGAWGTGKTTFIKMWKAKLELRNHLCLYFNAWETDFAVDPLVALIGELEAAVKLDEQKKPALSKAFDKVKKIGESVLRHSIPGMVRLATAGAVELSPAVEAELAGAAASFAEEQLRTYQESKKSLKAFRERLTELAESVQELANDPSAKLVFFVDELDRCRPTYAIEVLERIKHLFDVPGVVFVLGVDRSQLSHSVRSVYGQDFDATGYLRRFIDLDYVLPEPPPGSYCEHLYKAFGIHETLLQHNPGNKTHSFLAMLSSAASAARLSLRDQRQIVARLRLVLQMIPLKDCLFEYPLAALLFLRQWRRELYEGVVSGTIAWKSLHEAIETLDQKEEGPRTLVMRLTATLFACLQDIHSGRYGSMGSVEEIQGSMNLPITPHWSEERIKMAAKFVEKRNNDSDSDGMVGCDQTLKRINLATTLIQGKVGILQS